MEYPIIEGKSPGQDYSHSYIQTHTELAYLEKGIPYRELYYHSRMRDKATEFRLLKRLTETQQHCESLATQSSQLSLNRYLVIPYRHNAVKLSDSSYINASLIDGSCENTTGMFIATQGPKENTTGHFWKMVWEQDVTLIVMLCDFVENDHPKCAAYLPDAGATDIGDFQITVESDEFPYPSLRERVLSVQHLGEMKSVRHLHVWSWPDQGVPAIREEFHLINYTVSTIKSNWCAESKVVVHCSAGVGRTGLLIGIYNMVTGLEDLIRQGVEERIRVSVFGTIRRLREQRWGMIVNLKQYKFLYKFMEYWLISYFIHQRNHH